MRVVSLVPSWTEFLHDLDVNVVGQTKFCVRPQTAFRTLPRVGGTKTIKLDAVLGLEPDLVVANREENDREQIEALMAAMPSERVVVTDVRTVEHALDEMRRLGEAVDRKAAADNMIQRTKNAWGDPKPLVGRAGYAVWSSPWMVAGPDTFIHSVMAHWGMENAMGHSDPEARYPTLAETPGMGVGLCDCWLLPSEPFPFKGKHLRGFEENHPDKRFKLVDGEAFSWYGSRMLHVTAHLNEVRQWVARREEA